VLEILTTLASAATAIGVCVAAVQLLYTHKQSRTTFEDSLVQEYRTLVASLPLEALLGEDIEQIEYDIHLKCFYRYFELCNEQIYLVRQNRIRKKTWKFWRDGIRGNLARPAFRRAWSDIAHRAGEDLSELKAEFPPQQKSIAVETMERSVER